MFEYYIGNVPAYERPLTLRYVTFPEVYGNIENKILKKNLMTLNSLPEN